DAHVDLARVDRTAGLERDLEAGLAQHPEEREAAALCERLTAGDAHETRARLARLIDEPGYSAPFAAVERVGGVAVSAAQRATGQADEESRPADGIRLALERQKRLGDAESGG